MVYTGRGWAKFSFVLFSFSAFMGGGNVG